MKIRITQSGGYAGLVELANVDTATMTAQAAQATADALQSANLFAAPGAAAPMPVGADNSPVLTLTVTGDGHGDSGAGAAARTVTIPDDGSPRAAQVHRLIAAALQQP